MVIAVGFCGGDILYFVLIASGGSSAAKGVGRLRQATGPIGLIRKIPERAAENAVIAGFHGRKMMAPVLAGLEVPGEVG